MPIILKKKDLEPYLGLLTNESYVYINGHLLGFLDMKERPRLYQQFVQMGHSGWTLFGWFHDEPCVTEFMAAHIDYGMIDVDFSSLEVKVANEQAWAHFFEHHVSIINVGTSETKNDDKE